MSMSPDSSTDALILGSCRNGNESGGFWGRVRGRDSRSPSPKRALTSQGVQVQEILVIRGARADSGTKLCISNLDYGVSDEDIELLFSEIGELQRYSIHCDRKGRSKGTGEVVFARQLDALAAIDRYDNVRLDGKPMKVELVVESIDVYTKAKNCDSFTSSLVAGRDFRSPSPKRALTSQGVQVQEMLVIGGAKADSGTKLYISNLDYGVSDEDIELLFSEIGELQRYLIHCDRKGRSKGTGEVVFERQSDALAAIDRYDNVRLDGKPMKVELVVERIDVYTKAKNY